MKVTIELTDAQVKGIKKYHRENFGETVTPHVMKLYIQGIVSGTLDSPSESVSDYIRQFEKLS